MAGKTRKIRLFSLIAAAAMLLSVASAAGAADIPKDVIDAKDEIATVEITQTYSTERYTTPIETDKRTHNYETDGNQVYINYKATLQMTEEMATYLYYRQGQLMDAKFNVHVNMDMKLLEFAANKKNVTVTFTSTFLKPWSVSGEPDVENKGAFAAKYAGKYTSELKGYNEDTGVFTYEISVDREWAEEQDSFDIPMELIVYYDKKTNTAYSYNEVKEAADKGDLVLEGLPLMYGYFDVEDWTYPITASLAAMKVKDSVAETVTYDSATWKTVTASGTVDGEFSYIGESAADSIAILRGYEDAYKATGSGFVTTYEFGNGEEGDIGEEWKSNDVWVYLIRFITPIDNPDSPFLNLDDHFAYIIGYPDGLVHPEWNITRAEVATIFFRMLTDEVRDQYWSKTNPYNDVKATDWFNNAISTLTRLGVIEGYPDGGFHPRANITRAEFAAMAVRFFLITEDMYGSYSEDAFDDIANHWANKYINIAYLLDIIHGYPDGTYRPNNDITRAEAMTIVNNTLRRTPCNEGIEPMEDHEDFISWPDNMNKSMWYYAAVQEATNSHDYTYFTENKDLLTKELWVDLLPVRDWAAFEREWSNAHSAANPGEVVNGH